MTESERPAVADWATDFDLFDRGFMADPSAVYAELRERAPLARTERWGGSWMPTRYEDVAAVAYDTEHFSSREVGVFPFPGRESGEPAGLRRPSPRTRPTTPGNGGCLLPYFSPSAVERYELSTRALAKELMAAITASGRHRADAAVEYAQLIPPRIIAEVIGVPA